MVRPPLESSINTIKFLCSYGGKIVPRYPDGKLRYQGGHTRVLAVPRSVSFPELLMKMEELCGESIRIRCQLPREDLDALITIKSDEDIINLIEEYDRVTTPSSMKIRAFLVPLLTKQKTLSNSSPSSSPKTLSPSSLSPSSSFNFSASGPSSGFVPPPPPLLAYPINYAKLGSRKMAHDHQSFRCHHCCRNSSRVYLVENGNYWQ